MAKNHGKNRADAPDLTNGQGTDANGLQGQPDANQGHSGAGSPSSLEVSGANMVVGYAIPDGETDTVGKLAHTILELEQDNLRGICVVGQRIQALAKADKKNVKATCESLFAYSATTKANLSVQTLTQYAAHGALQETIGERYLDLRSFRRAQKVKTVLLKVGKENGLGAQLDVIERYGNGEDLDEIKASYGLATEKGLRSSDKDALEVAESRGDDPQAFGKDLAAKRIERMASSSWAKFIGKLIDKNELETFLCVIERVKAEKANKKPETKEEKTE